MNVIFISPQFPSYYYNFCERLKERGAHVLGIGDTPYGMISQQTKDSLTEYYYLPSLEDYDSVYKAVAFFTAKYGRISWIESENEYWLELEAALREDYNIKTGPHTQDMKILRHKSKMKDVYKSAGIPVAKYCYLNSLEDALELIKEVGYPVIVKPDNGMGASETYKVKNLKELEELYNHKNPDIQYIVEDYIPGRVETFEGITDYSGNIMISTSHVMCDAVMDMVNEHLESTFYSQPVNESTDIYKIGLKTVKAFKTKARFFHFEFIRLKEDKDYLGKKGDLVGLEVNMRAPGAYIPEMMNFCYDVDVYTIWADMILFNTCYYDIERKYYVAYAGRRKEKTYALTNQEIRLRFHKQLVLETDVPASLAQAMSDHVFIYRTETKTEMNEIMKAIISKEPIIQAPVKKVKKPKVQPVKQSKPKKQSPVKRKKDNFKEFSN